MIIKKKHPRFHRSGAHRYKRIGKQGWRRPKGKDSLQRRAHKSRGAVPEPGYRQPREIRGLHPSGLCETLVHNVKELEQLAAQKATMAARVSGSVGARKKRLMLEKAKTLGIKVLNPGVAAKKTKKTEKTKETQALKPAPAVPATTGKPAEPAKPATASKPATDKIAAETQASKPKTTTTVTKPKPVVEQKPSSAPATPTNK